MSCTPTAGRRALERLLQGCAEAWDAGQPLLLPPILTEGGFLHKQLSSLKQWIAGEEGGWEGGGGAQKGAEVTWTSEQRGTGELK